MKINKDKIKLIAIDFDGTFLDDNHFKSDLSYFEKLKNIDKEIVFASGRATAGIIELLKRIGISDNLRYVIGHNGAEIYDLKEKKIIYQKKLDDTLVYEIIDLLDKGGYKNPLCIHDWINLVTYRYKEVVDLECECNYTELVKIDDVNKFPKEKLKLMIFTDGKEIDDVYRYINESEYKDKVTLARSANIMVEVTDKSVDKSTGLEYLCNMLNIGFDEVLAFGNAENDIAMVTKVAYGFAMKNSEKHLLEVAKNITKYSNDECGVEREIIDILGL